MSSAPAQRLTALLQAEQRMHKIDELRSTQAQIDCLTETCKNKIDSRYSVSMCDECRDRESEENGGKLQRCCQAVLAEVPARRCSGTIRTGSWFCSRHQSAEMYPHDRQVAEQMACELVRQAKKRRAEHEAKERKKRETLSRDQKNVENKVVEQEETG
jgi:hypothetical protein